MSIPVNPLDKFRSYAYHHILIAADSTEAMRFLTDPAMSDMQQQDLFSNLQLGKRCPINGSSAGFFMICDTRQNSYFSINEISYSSVLTSGAASWSGTITSMVDMKLSDPSGVSFLNYIKYITDDQLKISLCNITFLLKTIFVGHTDAGTTETVYQNAIAMLLFDMTLSPSHQGSTINAKFVPLMNGAVVNIQDYSKIFDIPGINSKTNRLKDAMKSLEDTLNSKSRKWYKDIQLNIINSNEESKKVKPSSGYGKLVQYMISVPDDWDAFKVIGVYDKMSETKFKSGGGRGEVNAKGVYIGLHTTTETTILDVIEMILKQSNDVQKLASNEARADKNVKSYKILTNLTSDDDTVTIHYDIVNYSIPNVEDDSDKNGKTPDKVDKTNAVKITENGKIEFDYIFSGKNTDIINFDMKVNNVNILLADNLVLGDKHTKESQKDQKNNPKDDTKTGQKDVIVIRMKEKDPICPPAKSGSQQSNMAWVTETDERQDAVKARQQFIYNMSMGHGISSFNVIMKIRGNPNLYKQFAEAQIPPHVKMIDNLNDVNYITNNDAFVNGTNNQFLSQNDVQSYLKFKDEVIQKKQAVESKNQATGTPSTYPFFVKMNIYGQDYDVLDKSENAFSQFKPFQRMWYNGYYHLFSIDHHFVNGDFYQELLLGAVPYDLYGQEESDTNKQKTTKPSDVEQKVKK